MQHEIHANYVLYDARLLHQAPQFCQIVIVEKSPLDFELRVLSGQVDSLEPFEATEHVNQKELFHFKDLQSALRKARVQATVAALSGFMLYDPVETDRMLEQWFANRVKP